MTDEFNWDKALDQWQNHQPDMPALKKNMRWLSWRMKIVLALDVLSLLVLFPFAYFIFVSNEPTSTKVWFSIICFIATVGVYFDFYLRKDLWDTPNSTPQMYQHLVKRAQAGVKIGTFSIIYLSCFFVFFAGWLGYLWLFEPARFLAKVGFASAIGASAAVIVAIAVSVWYRRRKVLESKEAKQRYQDFLSFDE
ncbi:MAG: hypothetical protein HWE13_04385 [Gammaproteobacteria bacterium]|nr:hypothetical protein [Gammaproteobacteria bacterium]NVK87336.1 hypothetical protein [Gammaproteobacteria bacterium]